MGEAMEEVGRDGYLFSLPNVSRRTLAEIEDGLVPALENRGLVRKAYAFEQFRDNLLRTAMGPGWSSRRYADASLGSN